MESIITNARLIFIAVITAIGESCGGYDQMLHAIILFVIIDYVTGVLRAGYEKKISSYIGEWGIVRKIVIFMVIAAANELDLLIGTDHLLRLTTISFFLSNEGISLLENIAALGIPIPPQLLNTLAEIKNRANNSAKKT